MNTRAWNREYWWDGRSTAENNLILGSRPHLARDRIVAKNVKVKRAVWKKLIREGKILL